MPAGAVARCLESMPPARRRRTVTRLSSRARAGAGAQVVQGALEKEPEHRTPTAAEMLRRLEVGPPAHAPGPPAAARRAMILHCNAGTAIQRDCGDV